MDPIRGGGPKPATTTLTQGSGVGASSAEGPDRPAGAQPTAVYEGSGRQAAANRGDWPPVADPGQGPAFGEATVDRCSAEIAKLEAELDKLGDGPEAMAKMMKLQRKLDTYTRIMTLVSEIWKSRSDAIRSCISNMS